MKQLSILVSACLFTTSLFAQLNKGQWLVGGNAGFSYEKISNNVLQYSSSLTQTTEQFAPAVGYFIVDKLCAGVRIASSFSNGTDSYSPADSIYNSKSTSYGISAAPFVRYYFLPKKNKVNLLADISYAWVSTQLTSTQGANKYTEKQNSHSYTVAAGPTIFLSAKTAIELTVAYTHTTDKNQFQTTDELMVNAGFQIYLGK